MLAQRLKKHLIACFVHVHEAKQIPNAHRVRVGTHIGTPHVPERDLKSLASKGLITYAKSSGLSGTFGVTYFDVRLTDSGREELQDALEDKCREVGATS